MNKKQDMVEKDSFRQAGEDLLRKVREEERADLRLALSSWQKLEERLNAPRKTSVLRIRYLVSSVAAAVMLLLAVGCYFWMMGHDKSSLPLALLEEKNVGALPGDEIVLVKDQGWVQLKDEATVIYDTVGKSNVEEHQIEKNEQETKIDEPDQIIVPKGRRANIVFSDGTKMYINAETRVIFPTVFAKDKREILVDGEVYLEVAADPSRPFIVKTSTIEVKVLGTRFNVCAYRDEPAASVVLVEGQVEVKNGDNGAVVFVADAGVSADFQDGLSLLFLFLFAVALRFKFAGVFLLESCHVFCLVFGRNGFQNVLHDAGDLVAGECFVKEGGGVGGCFSFFGEGAGGPVVPGAFLHDLKGIRSIPWRGPCGHTHDGKQQGQYEFLHGFSLLVARG